MKKITFFTLAIMLITVFSIKAQTWEEVAKALPTPQQQIISNQHYGSAIDIDGDYAVIGAYQYEGYGGIAYVLYNNTGTWETVAKLTASDRISWSYFGYSVSISGDNIVIGAYGYDDNGGILGSAYVFTKPSGGWTNMTETAKLTASDRAERDSFGKSVSISSDNIVIGAVGDDDKGLGSGSAYVFTKPSGGWVDMTETAKLTASDGAEKDYFGYSVSISGDDIIIGAYQDDDNTENSGSAYIFTKPSGGWSNMTQTAKLTASDGEENDWFGWSVSISGNNIIIGAYQDDDNGGNSGSAYVFTKPSGGWTNMTQTAKLTASDGASNDCFGTSVSISEDNVIVGAPYDDDGESGSGSAYIFTKPSGGWTNMTETAKLTDSDGEKNNYFGYSVSISGDNVIIGVPGNESGTPGKSSVDIFKKPSDGWETSTEDQEIEPPLYIGNYEDYFGFSVALDNNYAVIGAYGYKPNNYNKGMAYILYFDGYSWNKIAELKPSSDGRFFGYSVSISGDNIVVGDYSDGSAYVFTKPSGGWEDMTETAKLTDSDDSNEFGYSVNISGDNIVVGAPGTGVGGSAYVFTKPSGGWTNMTQTAKLTASDGANSDKFGYSINISGDNIVIGAYGDDDNGNWSGSAYVFTKPSGGWEDMTETAKLTASDGAEQDYFGYSVSVSSNDIVIGAYGDDDNGDWSGSAYVFTKPSGGWINMTETAKLTTSDGTEYDYFGYSVSISDDNIVVGAYQDNDNGIWSGSAYVFTKPSGGWTNMTQTAKLTANNKGYLGYSVSISNNNIVLGAPYNSDNSVNEGSAYLFRNCSETTSTINPSVCDSYTSPSGNYIWTTSGTYMDTIPNSILCDSVITIHLSILNNTGIDIQTACETFDWIDGNTYTESNNTATYALTNINGCDSVVTLNLTINKSNTGIDTQTACETFDWIDGNTYTESNNTATYTLTNVNGCDSIVTLNLTIINIDNTVNQNAEMLTANATGLSYQWLDCNNDYTPIPGETNQSFTAIVNGNYAVKITNGECTKTSDCYSVNTLGVNNLENSGITLYPNPVTDILQVKGIKKMENFRIVDNSGKVLIKQIINNTSTKIDISALKTGIYFIKIRTKNYVYMSKIIKQ